MSSPPSFRSMIRQLILVESRHLKWKFDPTVFEEPYDPNDPGRWRRVWTGVEKICGQWFEIECMTFIMVAKKVELRIAATALNSRSVSVVVVQTIGGRDGRVSDDQLERLRAVGDELRAGIKRGFVENFWGEHFEKIENFQAQLPPWRSGVWKVPGLDQRVKGTRLDLGLFQFVIPKAADCAYLIGRSEFVPAGSRPKAWKLQIWGLHQMAEAQKTIEQWLKQIDLDNHDPDYLAGIFKDVTSRQNAKQI